MKDSKQLDDDLLCLIAFINDLRKAEFNSGKEEKSSFRACHEKNFLARESFRALFG